MPTDTTECRPFRIGDAMVLIATIAIGIMWASRVWDEDGRVPPIPLKLRFSDYKAVIEESLQVASPILTVLTLSVLVLGLRPPRPSRRDLFHRPGITACAAASSVFFVSVVIRVLS